jgi:hypothetical protein
MLTFLCERQKRCLKSHFTKHFCKKFCWLLKKLELCAQKIFKAFLAYSKFQLAHGDFAIFAIHFLPKFDKIHPSGACTIKLFTAVIVAIS